MQKKNKIILVAFVLGLIYIAYSLYYWFGGGASGAVGASESAQLGAGIATALVTPHLVCVVVAVIFAGLAYFLSKAAFALVAGILYAISMVLFPPYFFFVLIQMILSFIAFGKMRKAAQA